MICELPGYASAASDHEQAIAAAQADGWQIRAFTTTFIPGPMSDLLMLCVLWKDGVDVGGGFGPLLEVARAKHAEKLASLGQATAKCGPLREEDLANEPTPKPAKKKR